MGIIGKFESAMQGVVEGSFGRVFRTRLQPVEISRKLERAMDVNLVVHADRRIAPNAYTVYLSARDYAQFEPSERTLSARLSESLIAVARARGYTLTSRPLVRFHEDDRIVTGQMRIETALLEPQSASTGQADADDIPLDETRALSPAEAQALAAAQERQARAQVLSEPLPQAWLTLYRPSRGQPMQLTKQVIHIGRHLTNDVVVNDRRVSRYHAEIRYEHGQFMLYDLGSTNGVRINGVPTRQPVPIRNNDILTVGSHEFVFQRR